MEQTTDGNEIGGADRDRLTPVGVVLRGIELHPREAGMEPFTCILDGYVVYAVEPYGRYRQGAPQPQQDSTDAEATGAKACEGSSPAASNGAEDQTLAPKAAEEAASPSPMSAQYVHYSYREDDERDGDDDAGCGDDDGEGMEDGGSINDCDAAHGQKADVPGQAAKHIPASSALADHLPTPQPTNATPTPRQDHYLRSRRRQVPGTIPPQMELSIRRKLGELGYRDDYLVIFLVERFRKTALHKLKWLEAYKLQQMLDNGEVQATRQEIWN